MVSSKFDKCNSKSRSCDVPNGWNYGNSRYVYVKDVYFQAIMVTENGE